MGTNEGSARGELGREPEVSSLEALAEPLRGMRHAEGRP